NRHASDRALRLKRKDKKALFFQFVAQACFVFSRVNAFHDLAAGGRETATEFHSSGVSAAIACHHGHYRHQIITVPGAAPAERGSLEGLAAWSAPHAPLELDRGAGRKAGEKGGRGPRFSAGQPAQRVAPKAPTILLPG